MLKRFLPRQEKFFDLFQKTADILVLTATQFHILIMDPENQEHTVAAISNYEKEADSVAHATFQLLHKTFITPFDRDDIHRLTSGLDDILDTINRCALRFPFYNIKSKPADLIELTDLVMQCAKLLKKAIYRLQPLDQSDEILKYCEAIDELESKSAIMVLEGEKALIESENDFKQFYKLNAIYSQTKDVISICQDVANVIKSIVLEYS